MTSVQVPLHFLLCPRDQCSPPCPGVQPIKESNAVTVSWGLAPGGLRGHPCLSWGFGSPSVSPGRSPRESPGEAQPSAQGTHVVHKHSVPPCPAPGATTSLTLRADAEPSVCLPPVGWILPKPTGPSLSGRSPCGSVTIEARGPPLLLCPVAGKTQCHPVAVGSVYTGSGLCALNAKFISTDSTPVVSFSVPRSSLQLILTCALCSFPVIISKSPSPKVRLYLKRVPVVAQQ